jgi:hypothetical protein
MPQDLMTAMYYLESIEDDMTRDDVDSLVTAAHYMIQRHVNGHEPENFDEVVACADYVSCPA